MKKLIIDVDDVITGGELINSINNFLNTNYTEEDSKDYYLQKLLGDREQEYFDNFENINLYENAKSYKDCYEVLKKLNDKYDVYFCSAFTWNEAHKTASFNLKHKYDFLYREFDFILPNKYIFMYDKMMINCDIRIDDKINNLGNAKINLLYTAYHNKNITDEQLKEKNIIRVNNWKDIEKVLINN